MIFYLILILILATVRIYLIIILILYYTNHAINTNYFNSSYYLVEDDY